MMTTLAAAAIVAAACGGGDNDSSPPAATLGTVPSDPVFYLPNGNQYQQHLDFATANAGTDTQMIANRRVLCYVVDHTSVPSELSDQRLVEPTRIFDDFSYLGPRWVGQYALKTANGVVLFDTLNNAGEVDSITVPGFAKLGLDPKKILAAVLTHGHSDHHGGALHLKNTQGVSRIWVGSADRAAVAAATDQFDSANLNPVDFTVDGVTMKIQSTPGHTPGTISGVVPVTDKGKKHKLAFWGGTAEPNTIALARSYQDSAERMYRLSRDEKVEGTFHTHPFVDGSLLKMDRIQTGTAGSSNPFLVGNATVLRMYAVLRECAAAQVAKLDATAVIVPWRVTTTTVTGAELNAAGTGVNASAVVRDPYGPAAGIGVKFTMSGSNATCSAVTDASGKASCSVSQASSVAAGDVLTASSVQRENATAVWLPSEGTATYK